MQPPPTQQQQQARRMAAQPMDVSKHDELLCEGHLTKLKGNALQNRVRFFRLTDKTLAYYEDNAGKLISSIPKSALSSFILFCFFLLKNDLFICLSIN